MREETEKMLDDLKTERQHQLDFLEKSRNTYNELNKKGFRPLNSLLQLIATWEQNLSLVERQIEGFEKMLRDEHFND